MEKEFIPYELALKMKALGFDEPCVTFFFEDGIAFTGYERPFNYNKISNISRPTFSQAFRWFREKHNLLGGVCSNASGWEWEIHDNVGGTHRYGSNFSGYCEMSGAYTSYEKSELGCLEKLIEIVEINKKWDELKDAGLDNPFKGW